MRNIPKGVKVGSMPDRKNYIMSRTQHEAGISTFEWENRCPPPLSRWQFFIGITENLKYFAGIFRRDLGSIFGSSGQN